MSTEEATFLGLVDVGRRIRTREVSSVEVTGAILDRIARVDGRLKSFVLVRREQALSSADQADREIARGQVRGPLHGVPIAIKDLCDMAGTPTTAGTTLFADRVADRDATVVARLLSAGAVIVGKLKMTEGAFSTHHPRIEPPVNPWKADVWTGVSSSGSGVATAAGLCYGSLGTDTGGSIRFPSSVNGLTGLKPTWGRVSRAGVFPLAESLDHVGPMTRSAVDAAVMLGAIAGADPDDPTSSHHPVPDYLAEIDAGVRDIRIGIDRRFIAGADADMVRACEAAATVLGAAGARLSDVAMPAAEDCVRDWLTLCAVEAAVAHDAAYPARAGDYGPALRQLLDLGRAADGREVARILNRRAAYRVQLTALLDRVDLLLVPAMSEAAPLVADMLPGAASSPSAASRRQARLRYTAPFDMSGHPTLTLPGGQTADGVPVGLQIVGRHWQEDLILRAGRAFQRATDWHARHPPMV